jgi:hypothetical protein
VQKRFSLNQCSQPYILMPWEFLSFQLVWLMISHKSFGTFGGEMRRIDGECIGCRGTRWIDLSLKAVLGSEISDCSIRRSYHGRLGDWFNTLIACVHDCWRLDIIPPVISSILPLFKTSHRPGRASFTGWSSDDPQV